MMISSCFTTKVYGVHLISHNMTKPYVFMPTTGRTSGENHKFISTILFPVPAGTPLNTYWSITTDVKMVSIATNAMDGKN